MKMLLPKYKTFLLSFLLFIFGVFAALKGQEIDLENIAERTKEKLQKNPFKITGGVSARSVFYASDTESSKNPWTWFLNGNLNLGIYDWSIPISYSLTNQGSKLGYDIPFKFNKISIHPKYKSWQFHLGDTSVPLSPYTFSGLNFTGAGFEYNGQSPFKSVLFAGRLNKAVEDNEDPRTIPAFQRMGYGSSFSWEKNRYKLKMIAFYAKDDAESLQKVPTSKNVLPGENLVLSLGGSVFPIENFEVFAEVAESSITQNLLAQKGEHEKSLTSFFLKNNSSTKSYRAYNGGFNLSLSRGSVGIRYERVDPEYQTFGAYYFTNDLENLSLNGSLNLLEGKMNLSGSIGKQRDNLTDQKEKQTNRWTGSFNISWMASEKMDLDASYSNFTMFTNRNLNQFSKINDNPLSLQKPIDSINFRQVSQNTNIGVRYKLSENEKRLQNIAVNYSLSEAINREDGILRKGNLSRFHNADVNYSLSLPEYQLNISGSLNYTLMYASASWSNIWGPSFSLSRSFFEEKLRSSLGGNFNTSSEGVITSSLRLGGEYSPWEKHRFSADIVGLMRSSKQRNGMNQITASLGYGYSF